MSKIYNWLFMAILHFTAQVAPQVDLCIHSASGRAYTSAVPMSTVSRDFLHHSPQITWSDQYFRNMSGPGEAAVDHDIHLLCEHLIEAPSLSPRKCKD